MEEKEVLRRRLLAILWAAICGAILFDAMVSADNLAYESLKGTNSGLLGLVVALAYLQVIPSLATGLNIYLVNGLIGASLFGFAAAFWQFAIKKYEE